MQKWEKYWILGLVILVVVVLIMVIPGNKEEEKEKEMNTQEEKYAQVQDNGLKVNTSNKLKETKKLGNLEISNISLKSQGNESYITANVKNIGNTTDGDKFITITVLDDKQNIITKIDAYLSTIEAGQETILRSTTSADFANAYDFKVEE